MVERLNHLEQREKELMNEREEAEKDFGIKRAKFKELFLQKESKYGLDDRIRPTNIYFESV